MTEKHQSQIRIAERYLYSEDMDRFMSADQETDAAFFRRCVPHGHTVFWIYPIIRERTESWQCKDIRLRS